MCGCAMRPPYSRNRGEKDNRHPICAVPMPAWMWEKESGWKERELGMHMSWKVCLRDSSTCTSKIFRLQQKCVHSEMAEGWFNGHDPRAETGSCQNKWLPGSSKETRWRSQSAAQFVDCSPIGVDTRGQLSGRPVEPSRSGRTGTVSVVTQIRHW
jgi:hypothetical protein